MHFSIYSLPWSIVHHCRHRRRWSCCHCHHHSQLFCKRKEGSQPCPQKNDSRWLSLWCFVKARLTCYLAHICLLAQYLPARYCLHHLSSPKDQYHAIQHKECLFERNPDTTCSVSPITSQFLCCSLAFILDLVEKSLPWNARLWLPHLCCFWLGCW